MDDGKTTQGARRAPALGADAAGRPAGARDAAKASDGAVRAGSSQVADGAAQAGSTARVVEQDRLTAEDVSVFCEGMAMMLAAGIQIDEALGLLDVRRGNARLSRVCDEAYRTVISGCGLGEAMRRTGAFPRHAVDMVVVGERTGRLEQTLRRLTTYYDEEGRMLAKVRTAVGYPAALLCAMAVIVAFTVWVVLPVFIQVYEGMAGSLTAGSSAAIAASVVIGWAALVVTLVGAAAAVAAAVAGRTPRGNAFLIGVFERLPFTRDAMEKLALSRFTLALSTYLASGVNEDVAMAESIKTVEHPRVRARAEESLRLMEDPERACSLPTAIGEAGLLDALYARMVTIGARTGSIENVLAGLGETFFNEAADRIDRVIDSVEPLLAALLTIAVGATLISVMLPLIGIMGSIG